MGSGGLSAIFKLAESGPEPSAWARGHAAASYAPRTRLATTQTPTPPHVGQRGRRRKEPSVCACCSAVWPSPSLKPPHTHWYVHLHWNKLSGGSTRVNLADTSMSRRQEPRARARTPPPAPLGVLRGHGAPVNCVAFLSASTLVSGAGDGVVKLWDLKTRREAVTNRAAHSKAGVLHAAALPSALASAPRFATQGRDGYVKLWDAQMLGGEPLQQFYCGSYSFTKFSTLRWHDEDSGGSTLRTGSADATNLLVCPSSAADKLLVFDCRGPSSTPAMTLTVLDPENKRGMCMSLSLFESSAAAGSTQTYVAAGFEGGQLAILDLRSGGKLASEATVIQGSNALLSFDVSRDGRSAVCGSSGEQLMVTSFDAAALTLRSRSFFSCTHGGFSSVRIRGDQRIVATAGWDHRVRLFHLRKLQPLAVLRFHSESVFALDFGADDALLASSSKDQKIALWNVFPPSGTASNILRPY